MPLCATVVLAPKAASRTPERVVIPRCNWRWAGAIGELLEGDDLLQPMSARHARRSSATDHTKTYGAHCR